MEKKDRVGFGERRREFKKKKVTEKKNRGEG